MLGGAAAAAGCGTVTPPAPTGFSASGAGAGSVCTVSLTWTDNSGTCVDQEDGFTIERKLQSEGSGGWSEIAFSPAAQDAESTSDNTVSANTAYDYRIRSFNSVGVSSWVTTAHTTGNCGPQ